MNLWTPADVSLPVFRSNVDLLEYAINNIDTLGMLHATAQPEAFELRTGFLDDYQRMPALRISAELTEGAAKAWTTTESEMDP